MLINLAADLKPDNIMIRIEDARMFEKDAIEEYNNPLPEKQLDDRTIYLSRNNYGPLARPTGIIQLVDFDLAVHSKSGELHYGAIQGEIYRAPEVILNSGYSYSADIWSLGVMVRIFLPCHAKESVTDHATDSFGTCLKRKVSSTL
jgi:serine/threonine-protein kinase SRPK3